MSEPESDICSRCNKAGHIPRHCKAPFRKSWPGKPAIVIKVRDASGAYIEVTANLSARLLADALALALAVYKGEQ